MQPISKAHVILLLAVSAASAQTISSTIKGTVQDSSGAQIDSNIGLPSSARPPRNIQLSLRLTF